MQLAVNERLQFDEVYVCHFRGEICIWMSDHYENRGMLARAIETWNPRLAKNPSSKKLIDKKIPLLSGYTPGKSFCF